KPLDIRRGILDLDRMLKKMGCTSMLTSEVQDGGVNMLSFGVEEFTSDGIIIMYFIHKKNIFIRALTVRKMRATKHDTGIHPLEITKNGIVVYPNELISIQ
ncbi:MAG: ATPase domain-containing protein, partial [Candidatus Aenigmatarchaeota archaeon]